ncbi:MAG: ribose ABC transporter permease [Thermoanaerobacteraceae bacterium]|nr:ribose ABC transporter permease [Thermoanaerobacteraceae bacterium]
MQSFVGLIALCAILSLLSPRFLTASNILNVLRQTSLNAVMAIGMTFVILTGGIDLSVGSVLAFSSIVAAGLAHSGVNAITAIFAGLIIGTVLGFINGLAVTKGNVPPFIATLAMMTMARGATLVYSNGQPKTGLGEGFYFLGNARIGSIPFPVIVLLVVFIIAYYILSETATGRYIYATGSNENAAKLTGIKTDRVKLLVYSISGFTAALSGMMVTSMLNSAPPTAGTGAELDAIAAVVLGGTSLSGGQGGVVGTIVGALIIGVLNNGLNLLNVSSYYQQLIKGAVILMAVLIDRRRR